MTDNTNLYNSVAPLRNVAAFATLVDRVKNRTHSLPGMGVFYGPSGFGKTTAGIYSTNKYSAISVQIKSVWTKKTLCEKILAEMGIPVPATVPKMLDLIAQHLTLMDVPLLIDEADFLVKRKMIEIVRDIHEESGAAIILIGEELLPQKLQEWERVYGRVQHFVPAEPADLNDVALLAKIYARGLELTPDLQRKLLDASNRSIRRISVNLDRIREFAAVKGLKRVSLETYSAQDLFTGVAPEVRRFGVVDGRRAG